MAKAIYDPDGHTKNFCILSKTACEVLPKVICWEINRHITQFELEELLRRRLKSQLNEIEEHCSVMEHTTLSSLCTELQNLQSKANLNNDTCYIVSPKDVNEIRTLIEEVYVFEEKRMIPKPGFKKLWRKLKNLCRTFDRRCCPKLISYQQQCKHIKENFRYNEVHDICNLVRNHWEMEDESLKQHVIQLRCIQEDLAVKRKNRLRKTVASFLRLFKKRVGIIMQTDLKDENISALCVSASPYTGSNQSYYQAYKNSFSYMSEDTHLYSTSRTLHRSSISSLYSQSDKVNDIPGQYSDLFNDESSILEMDTTDDEMHYTMEKYVQENTTNQESSHCDLELSDSSRRRVHLVNSQSNGYYAMFCDTLSTMHAEKQKETCSESLSNSEKSKGEIWHQKETKHPPGLLTKEFNQQNSDSQPTTGHMFSHFITRSSLPNTETSSSFLNSSDSSDCSSVQNQPPSIVKEDFIDLNSKCSADYEDKIEASPVAWSSEGLKFVLDNTSTPVLLLQLNIFSESVVCDTDMEVALNRRDQFYVYIIKTCIEEATKNMCFFLIQILHFRQVSPVTFFTQLKTPVVLSPITTLVLPYEMDADSVKILHTEKKNRFERFQLALKHLLRMLQLSCDVRNQKKFMIQSSAFSEEKEDLQLRYCEVTVIPVPCSENQMMPVCRKCYDFETASTFSTEKESFADDMKNITYQVKHPIKTEKYELRKLLTKRIYSTLYKEKVSKKKFHQTTRQGSLRWLMTLFFQNFTKIEKKDHNDISKIINHYFNLLSFGFQPRLSFPVDQNTPNRLETFFQETLQNEEASETDTLHMEWMRLRTFSSFPSNCKVSTVQLARDGFYYTGQATETQCFCCGQKYRDWDESSNINEIHRRISPECDIANGRSTRNIAIHAQGGAIDFWRNTEGSPPQEIIQEGASGQSDSAEQTSQQAELEEEQDFDQEEESKESTSLSTKPSKSKKRNRKKKKKGPSNEATASASKGGFVITEVPPDAESEDNRSTISSEERNKSADPATSQNTEETAQRAAAVGGLQIEEVQPQSAPLSSFSSASRDIGSSSRTTSVSPQSSASQHETPQQSRRKESVILPGQSAGSGANLSGPSQSKTKPSGSSNSGANTTDLPKSRENTAASPPQSAVSTGSNSQGRAVPPEPSRGGANPPSQTPAERLAQLDPLGINFDKPKYPAYAVYSNRLSSFDGWPSHMAQTPRDMARAGYFYAGYGDYARCFFCGGGLRNWDRSDDPWTEHARWFPRCAFLRNNKGDRYVARIQRIHQEQEAGLEPSFQILAPQERDLDTSLAEALREMGYTNQIIQTAMDQWRRRLRPGRRHPPAMSAAGLLDVIEELDKNTEDRAGVHTEQPLTIPGGNTEDRASASTEQSLTIPGADDNPSVEEPPRLSEENTEDGVIMLQENRTGGLVAQGESRDYRYDQRERQERQILQEEFLGLTETLVCKICCDKDVAAAFLPCGHLVCCLDCAPAMRKCPLCGEVIKGTVKTYFA
nr:uncharacterized protein LOC117691130 isoform X2 [Crassostrea gigas]XP_034332382.1 uncharacterized protein LOC117691130 isoform X2 [Crassostrea gigas]